MHVRLTANIVYCRLLTYSYYHILYRNFLWLGNPLCCAINDVDKDRLNHIARHIRDQKQLELDQKEVVLETEDVGLGETSVAIETDEMSETLESTDQNKSPILKSVQSGQPLTLARIQSLVSMTTPCDGMLYGGNTLWSSPPFIELDMTLDGFGCQFLPSFFPQVM